MALTKVSGHVVDQPFDVGIITATNQYVSGIGTFANLRVLGDLQVDGTTTTLDTVVTSVDRLEVGANNNTVGVAITQSGTGDIFNLYDGSSEVFSVADGGTVTVTGNIVGVTSAYATKFYGDGSALTNLAIDSTKIETGNTKVETVDTGSDGHVKVTTEGTERLRVQKGGNLVLGTTVEDTTTFRTFHVHGDYSRIKLTDQFSGTGHTDGLDIQCSGGNIYHKYYENGHVYFSTNNINRFQIKNDGQISFLNTSEYGFIKENGTGNLQLGATTNVKVSTGSTDRVIINGDGGTASVKVGTAATFTGAFTNLQLHNAGGSTRIVLTDQFTGSTQDDGFHIQCSGGGATLNLKENSHLYFRTQGLLRASIKNSGEFKMHGSNAAVFGDNEYFKIYYDGNCNIENTHNASNFFIASGLGMQLRVGGAELALSAVANGAVTLAYDNTEKFKTTSTGAEVLGALEVTQEYPSIRPVLDLNFAATKTLDRRITFTRDGLATFTDENGLVKYASNNVPRFDHDPATGESLGLLIEESRTNLLTKSEDFSTLNLNYSSARSTITSTTELAPDGTNTATKVVRTSGQGTGEVAILTSGVGGVTSGNTYTSSLFVKYLSGSNSNVVAFNNIDSTSGESDSEFNLSTGAIVTAGNQHTTSIIPYANGWYRIILSNRTASTNGAYFWIRSFNQQEGSGGFLLWGGQLEQGSVATSYIPTKGSAVTRAQDIPLITGTNFTDFYNQSEGTLVLSAETGEIATSNQAAVVFEDTSNVSSSFIAMGYNTGSGGSGHVGAWYNTSGTTSTFKSHNVGVTVGKEFRQAFAYKLNDFASVANGGTPLTDNSGTLTSLIDRVRFGQYHYDGMVTGHIKQFKYYPKRLPNAQLQGLTQQ